jgi:hypothetical protein
MRKYSVTSSLNAAITELLSKHHVTTISCFAEINV